MLEKLVAFIAPHDCIVCFKEGSLLCLGCRLDLSDQTASCCYLCRRLTTDFQVCLACRSKTVLKNVWVATDYTPVAKQLLRGLKFSRQSAAAEPMIWLLDQVLPVLPENTCLVHIPTATNRVRMRGYDQAKLLSTGFARSRGSLSASLLGRHGQSRQVGAGRKQRIEQIKDQFYVFNESKVHGKTILLIDDVLTTGATMEAAARTLKRAGAKSVYGAVFARR